MLYHAKGMIGYYQRSVPYAAGGLECCKPLSGSGGRSPDGSAGSETPEDREILHFTVSR